MMPQSPAPNHAHALIPGACEYVTDCGKRGKGFFEDVMTLLGAGEILLGYVGAFNLVT